MEMFVLRSSSSLSAGGAELVLSQLTDDGGRNPSDAARGDRPASFGVGDTAVGGGDAGASLGVDDLLSSDSAEGILDGTLPNPSPRSKAVKTQSE